LIILFTTIRRAMLSTCSLGAHSYRAKHGGAESYRATQ